VARTWRLDGTIAVRVKDMVIQDSERVSEGWRPKKLGRPEPLLEQAGWTLDSGS
jgi:hypothetical protein